MLFSGCWSVVGRRSQELEEIELFFLVNTKNNLSVGLL